MNVSGVRLTDEQVEFLTTSKVVSRERKATDWVVVSILRAVYDALPVDGES